MTAPFMRAAVAAAALLLALPAAAQELPKFPKAGPPAPLPEAECDVTLGNDGGWLLGRWVGPQTRLEFARQDGAIVWRLERRGGLNEEFGWREGAVIEGAVAKASGCTVEMTAGEADAFRFEGVLTAPGKLFGFATNRRGEHVRFVLRRER